MDACFWLDFCHKLYGENVFLQEKIISFFSVWIQGAAVPASGLKRPLRTLAVDWGVLVGLSDGNSPFCWIHEGWCSAATVLPINIHLMKTESHRRWKCDFYHITCGTEWLCFPHSRYGTDIRHKSDVEVWEEEQLLFSTTQTHCGGLTVEVMHKRLRIQQQETVSGEAPCDTGSATWAYFYIPVVIIMFVWQSHQSSGTISPENWDI